MYHLHDRTRRRIALSGFVLLCLVPTALVLAYGIARHLPGYARQEAQRLGLLLGVRVSLEGMQHLRPGVVRYEGLVLEDAETQQAVFRCARLEVRQESSEGSAGSGRRLVLIGVDAQLEGEGLPHLQRLVEALLARRLGGAATDLRLTVKRLRCPSGAGTLELFDLQGSLQSQEQQTEAVATCCLAQGTADKPVSLRIVRSRQGGHPQTAFVLSTGAGAFPCAALAPALPWMDSFGPASWFAGSLQGAAAADTWEMRLQGQFVDVDLQRLTQRSLYPLTGTARVLIKDAWLCDGRVRRLAGSVAAGPGEVSRLLLDAATTYLGATRPPQQNLSQSPRPYEQLGLAFLLDASGLVVRGQCPPAGSGVILADRYGPLLIESGHDVQPISALVHAMLSTGDARSPAASQAYRLLKWLPLPEEPER